MPGAEPRYPGYPCWILSRLADSHSTPKYVNDPSQDQHSPLTDTYLFQMCEQGTSCYAIEVVYLFIIQYYCANKYLILTYSIRYILLKYLFRFLDLLFTTPSTTCSAIATTLQSDTTGSLCDSSAWGQPAICSEFLAHPNSCGLQEAPCHRVSW